MKLRDVIQTHVVRHASKTYRRLMNLQGEVTWKVFDSKSGEYKAVSNGKASALEEEFVSEYDQLISMGND